MNWSSSYWPWKRRQLCEKECVIGSHWLLASVVIHTVVTDLTIRQPGFDFRHHTWSLMNRFWAGQGPCRANLHKWGLAQWPSCDCGHRQTMNHIVDTYPLTKFEGGLNLLHEVDDDDAVLWPGIYSDCSIREILTANCNTVSVSVVDYRALSRVLRALWGAIVSGGLSLM